MSRPDTSRLVEMVQELKQAFQHVEDHLGVYRTSVQVEDFKQLCFRWDLFRLELARLASLPDAAQARRRRRRT